MNISNLIRNNLFNIFTILTLIFVCSGCAKLQESLIGDDLQTETKKTISIEEALKAEESR